MKVKKNYYYLLISIFILLSLTILFKSGFFPKLLNVVDFVKNRKYFVYIKQDSLFNNYIRQNQYNIDIRKYSLNLNLYPKKGSISGEIDISGLCIYKCDTITLNFEKGFNIKSLLYNGKRIKYEYKNNYLEIFTTLKERDSFDINIEYSGQPVSKGLGSFVFDEYKGYNFIYTLNEPIYASSWYPCNDRPDDKALFDVKITSDKIYTSVSNGNLIDIKTIGDRKSYHYKSEYPLSTYLFCIYSGKYYYYEDYVVTGKKDTVRLSYYLLDQEDIEKYIDYSPIKDGIKIFSDLFGVYPFKEERYGNAQITWKYGAIEHQTITGLGTHIIKNPFSKRLVFIHELAHQWWGNAIGLKSWKDIWLNEGFATYSEALYAEKLSGKEMYMNVLQSKVGDFEDNTLYAPENNMFSTTVYNKGAWVLHMLRNKIGDEKFFIGLRTFFDKYKYKNASTNDFITVMEQISGQDLKLFFDGWVFKGKGLLNIQYNYKIINNNLFITIKLGKNKIPYNFLVDIELELKSGEKIINKNEIFGNDTTLVIKNIGELSGIVIDPEDKLLKKIELLK